MKQLSRLFALLALVFAFALTARAGGPLLLQKPTLSRALILGVLLLEP
jgi:hypothetical protein